MPDDTDKTYLRALGRVIASQRELHGFRSREALHQTSGLDPHYLGRVERGEANPSVLYIRQVAHCLGLSTPELLAMVERLIAS
jgi:XRE family aerobic/anaerobic benzoate catabolism transcriptional regulator